MTGPLPPVNLLPALKKARSESGLNVPAVSAALNKDFLSKKIDFGPAESAEVERKYSMTSWPTYLYFSPDGELLYRRLGNVPAEQRYLQDLQAVRQAQSDSQVACAPSCGRATRRPACCGNTSASASS